MRCRKYRLALLFLLSSVQAWAEPAVQASAAWLRAMPPGQVNSAAYMILHNHTAAALRVVAVSSPAARSVEVHESRQVDGMWQMRRLESLALPAGGEVALEPGGAHLMVFGLNPTPAAGDTICFELQLDNGDTVLVDAQVRKSGSPAKPGD